MLFGGLLPAFVLADLTDSFVSENRFSSSSRP